MKVLINDQLRYKKSTGYGALSRAIIESLDGLVDVYVKNNTGDYDHKLRKSDFFDKIALKKSDSYDVELYVGSPDVKFIQADHPQLIYTQNALSNLTKEWVVNLKRYDAVIVPGLFDSQVFSRHLSKVHTCYQYVDDRVFRPFEKWRSEGDKKFTFTFIGSYSYRKGVDLLIESFCKAFPNNEARLNLICPGAKDINHLLNLIRLHNPMSDINIYIDNLSPEWICRFINRSDAFVTLTRGEGWCMPIHESLLCNKPVICPESSAMKECFTSNHVKFVECVNVAVDSVHDEFAQGFYKKYGSNDICCYEPKIDSAIESLIDVFTNYEKHLVRANEGKKHVIETFSLKKLGDNLNNILAQYI